MKHKYVFSIVAAAVGSVALAAAAVHAEGWGHHGHHHGFGAEQACIVTMTSTQKAGLKAMFSSAEPGLKQDRQTVMADKQAVATAILSGNSSQLSTAEGQLSKDEATLQTAKDALAVQICSNANLTKASALDTGLQTLHQNTHQQASILFQNARSQ